MPTTVPSSQLTPGKDLSGWGQPSSTPVNPSQHDDSGSGGKYIVTVIQCEGLPVPRVSAVSSSNANSSVLIPIPDPPPSRRRLHKPVSEANLHSSDSKGGTGSRFGVMSKRRLSIKDSKAPQGPRPQDHSQKR